MQISLINNISFNGLLRLERTSVSESDEIQNKYREIRRSILNAEKTRTPQDLCIEAQEQMSPSTKILVDQQLRSEQIQKYIQDLEQKKINIDNDIIKQANSNLLSQLNKKNTDIVILNNGLGKQLFLLEANNCGEDSYIPADENGRLYETIIDIGNPGINIAKQISKFFTAVNQYLKKTDTERLYSNLTDTESGQDLYVALENDAEIELLAGEQNNLAEEIFQNHCRRSREITVEDMIE